MARGEDRVDKKAKMLDGARKRAKEASEQFDEVLANLRTHQKTVHEELAKLKATHDKERAKQAELEAELTETVSGRFSNPRSPGTGLCSGRRGVLGPFGQHFAPGLKCT